MKISEKVVEQVKMQADILDVIGEYVRLKKAGSRYVGLCPFHEDKKTPSFSVSPHIGVYHCFGCKKSGNTFTFLKDYLGLSFGESVEYLAKKYNIEITHDNRIDTEKDTKIDACFKVLSAAAEFYLKNLRSKQGEQALNYFKKRNFNNDTIKSFLLGYSPDSFDETSKELFKQGFTEQSLVDSGLWVVREDGKKYDRFRGRAMFAIKDFLGRVVGFGARQIKDEENQPKYINSPQTIVYDKSKILYGIFEAKNAIRNANAAIIVEGYADLLSLFQAGIKNVVASSGTALTKQHLSLLSRYTNTLFFVFDADDAGGKATDRAIEFALEEGFDIKVVSLPKGEDPDSIIQRHGRSVFEAKIADSTNFLDYSTRKLLASSQDSPAAKAGIARDMLALIAKVKDRLQHDFLIADLASLLDLTENQVRMLYNEKGKIENSNASQDENHSFNPTASEYEDDPNISFDVATEDFQVDLKLLLPEERLLLKIALTLPKYFTMLLDLNVSEATFITDTGKMLFEIIIEYSDELNIVQTLMESDEVSPAITQALIDILMSGENQSENWKIRDTSIREVDRKEMIEDILWRLQIITIDMEISEVKNKFKNSEEDQKDRLLLRQFELSNQKNEMITLRLSKSN